MTMIEIDKTHYVLTLEVSAEKADALALWLTEEWAVQPVILQKPNHDRAWLEIYYPSAIEAEIAQRALSRHDEVLAAQVRRCDPRDWLSFWQHHFKVQDIGKRLRICPVWEKEKIQRDGRKIVLVDPGASFGTGDHFTTRFCLEMLDRLCQKSALHSLLDVGTGSGILAIAAAKLGCRRALGLENDALALKQAKRNVALNRVTARVKLKLQDIVAQGVKEQFDVVCANIVSGLLVDIAPKLVRCAQRYVIVSGIRESEADGVADAYMAQGAREIVRDGDGEWVGMMFDVERK